MVKEQTNLTLNPALKRRAQGAVKHHCIPGVTSLVGLTEKAWVELFEREGVPKKFDEEN